MAKFKALRLTALYERLSKDDELKGESNSISNQKKYLEDYARKNGFQNLKHYTDDGFTGTNFNRPGFQEMIADVEAGKIDTIIVKDMSRFGRNYLQVGFYTEMVFPQKNVRFIAINNSVDSDNPVDNDFTPFLNIMNEWYAKDTSNKIKAVFNSRMSEGLRCSGSIPYGYNRLPDDKQKLVVDPVASKVVKRIFDMASVGTPISEIAKTLEAEKVLIPSAYTAKYHPEQNNNRTFKDPYRWRYGTISDIINRREYLGHTVLKKSERANFKMKNRKAVAKEDQLLFENTHEPIVSKEIWDKAQKFRQRARSKRVNPAGTFTEGHLLGGLVFCADCGSRMRAAVGGTDREHPYFSFRCGKHASDRRVCSSHNIGEVSLEKLVLTTIQRIMSRVEIDEEAFAEELKEKYEQKQEEIPDRDKAALAKCRKRYDEVDSLIKGLYENYVAGILPERQYHSLMIQYDEEQEELEKEITELEARMEILKPEPVQLQRFIDIIRKYKYPEELTAEVVNELIDKIIVHDFSGAGSSRTQKVEIHFNFVGEINLAYTEDELKAIQAEKEAKELAKKEAQKERGKEYRARKKAERYAANEGHKFAKRICEQCGKEYWPNSSKQKYCSSECKYAHDREVILAKRYEEKGDHTFTQKICKVCGKPFWPTSGREVMCSEECKEKNSREYREKYTKEHREARAEQEKQKREEKKKAAMAENDGHLYPAQICEQCGKEYWPTRPSQKYCSKECGRAHEAFVRMNRDPAEKEGHKFFKKQCVVCGKEFWPSGPNSICCCDECRKQRISIRKKANYDAVKRAAV